MWAVSARRARISSGLGCTYAGNPRDCSKSAILAPNTCISQSNDSTRSATSPSARFKTQFAGGQADDNLVIVTGALREGRSEREKQRLLRKVSQGISRVMSKPENKLILAINEIISATTMEFGLVLPQPGGEPDLFERNKEALKGVTASGF